MPELRAADQYIGSAATNGKLSPIEILQPKIFRLGLFLGSEDSDPLSHQSVFQSFESCVYMEYHSICETLVVTRLHPTAQTFILVPISHTRMNYMYKALG